MGLWKDEYFSPSGLAIFSLAPLTFEGGTFANLYFVFYICTTLSGRPGQADSEFRDHSGQDVGVGVTWGRGVGSATFKASPYSLYYLSGPTLT